MHRASRFVYDPTSIDRQRALHRENFMQTLVEILTLESLMPSVPEVAAEVVKCCFLLICRVNKRREARLREYLRSVTICRGFYEGGDEWSGNEWKNERQIRRWRDWYDALR